MNSKLSELNGKKSYSVPRPHPTSIFTEFSQWFFRLEKVGKVVTLNADCSGNMESIYDFSYLCKIPEEYCPSYDIFNSYRAQTGADVCIHISADGNVELVNYGTSIDGFFIRQCLSWMTI